MQLEQELQRTRQQVRGASVSACNKLNHSFSGCEVQELIFFYWILFSMQGMLVASGIPGDLSHNMAAAGNGEGGKQRF